MATETRRDGIDLILTRYYAAPPEKLWQAWTDVDVLKTWFAPDPVKITEAVFDARPGGLFQITMLLPDGTEFSSPGCVIEAIPNRKLVFTDALGPDFRPTGTGFMTSIVTFEPEGAGTRYTARVLHKDAEDCTKHEEMGFHPGWSAVAEQLGELVEA